MVGPLGAFGRADGAALLLMAWPLVTEADLGRPHTCFSASFPLRSAAAAFARAICASVGCEILVFFSSGRVGSLADFVGFVIDCIADTRVSVEAGLAGGLGMGLGLSSALLGPRFVGIASGVIFDGALRESVLAAVVDLDVDCALSGTSLLMPSALGAEGGGGRGTLLAPP